MWINVLYFVYRCELLALTPLNTSDCSLLQMVKVYWKIDDLNFCSLTRLFIQLLYMHAQLNHSDTISLSATFFLSFCFIIYLFFVCLFIFTHIFSLSPVLASFWYFSLRFYAHLLFFRSYFVSSYRNYAKIMLCVFTATGIQYSSTSNCLLLLFLFFFGVYCLFNCG